MWRKYNRNMSVAALNFQKIANARCVVLVSLWRSKLNGERFCGVQESGTNAGKKGILSSLTASSAPFSTPIFTLSSSPTKPELWLSRASIHCVYCSSGWDPWRRYQERDPYSELKHFVVHFLWLSKDHQLRWTSFSEELLIYVFIQVFYELLEHFCQD